MNKNAIGLHKFSRIFRRGILQYFPHIPCRLQPKLRGNRRNASTLPSHAPCRLQRPLDPFAGRLALLCLHTLRADCNFSFFSRREMLVPLPPHAPCRLQPLIDSRPAAERTLPPHAPCRLQPCAERITRRYRPLPPHAPCRLQRQKCTELQYALFRTCVELVDSFSVLNKAMLR